MKHSLLIAVVAAVSLLSLTANAALHKRGALMVYDDVLNITWLLDANYAVTSGYAASNKTGNDNDLTTNAVWSNGRMGWDAAKAWASQLTITDATYGTVSGWRLASARLQTPVNYNDSVDGTSDRGFNIVRSELGHMFSNNLGNKALVDANGYQQSGYDVINRTDASGSIAIQNLYRFLYWNDEESVNDNTYAWTFHKAVGFQGPNMKNFAFYAWAVRDGDVASEVPLPAAVWLFGAALAGLAGVRRRK